jgi:predicted DCC family thiol-disulfide oxidoreductase YuxK
MCDGIRGKAILLFDGYCNLCSGLVGFALRHDKHDCLRFRPLQDPASEPYLRTCCLSGGSVKSVVLIEGTKVSLKSTGALRLMKILGWPWAALYVFILVPRFLRDPLYDLAVRLRYRLCGRRESLRAPLPGEEEKFKLPDWERPHPE